MVRHSDSQLSGWGRLFFPGRERLVEDLVAGSRGASLTRGLGRSYGDSSLPSEGGDVICSRRADRIVAFDWESGLLRADSGLTLRELNRLLLPRGWFTPVSPGTQEVTLGGMVAADVHGKNHHVAGTFGRHVTSLLLRTGAGQLVTCSREERSDLFLGTLGGMGMTGHIVQVEVQLQSVASSWIERESIGTRDLEHSMTSLVELGERWPYTVAWIDCLVGGRARGRGVVEGGDWCSASEKGGRGPTLRTVREVPFFAPSFLLNRWSLAVYNRYRFWRHGRRTRRKVVSYEEFFYPLDSVGEWSRLYGRRGLTQYQCVLPRKAGNRSVPLFLERMIEYGGVPFLVVLKDFGAEGDGVLSFPQPGFTLAIDFAVDPRTESLVGQLDDLVLELGGRIYLAKEMFSQPAKFATMEAERLERFLGIKEAWDPEGRIKSRQWSRLMNQSSE